MRIDDTTLWLSFLNGSRTSFEAIYHLYYQNLYEYGMRRVDDRDLVKDSIQDIFVRLWTNRVRIKPTDNIKYYLLHALKNQLINVAKAPARSRVASIEEAGDFIMHFPPGAEHSPPDTNLLRKEEHGEQAQRLREALDGLTAKQKEIIYLRYFEELSYEEIAAIMNISVKGTYKLLYRALDALKEIMKISRKDLLLLLIFLKG
ncbi:MAG: RNA polymerase sigma factor [Bacteroidetes bacterium]|nr:RNA polymerase sigma factor [Bacteroidota bacterium]